MKMYKNIIIISIILMLIVASNFVVFTNVVDSPNENLSSSITVRDYIEGTGVPNNPNKLSEPDPIFLRVILTISMIVITIRLIPYIFPKLYFLPLFCDNSRLSIYSMIRENGVIQRNRIFAEPYEVNEEQIIIDITDTLKTGEQYSFLEIEIPKDVVFSTENKIVNKKKVEETTPRTLVITKNEMKDIVKVSPITEDMYNKEKDLYIAILNV